MNKWVLVFIVYTNVRAVQSRLPFHYPVTTVAGGRLDQQVTFDSPTSVAVGNAGTLYVADFYNHRICAVTADGIVTVLTGNSGTPSYSDGKGTSASFAYPFAIAFDHKMETLYVLENHRIRKVTTEGVVTSLAGSVQGYADGIGTNARFESPLGIAIDTDGTLYVSDSNRIRKVTAGGNVTTIAGAGGCGYVDGDGTSALFDTPQGIAVDGAGNVYVSDYENSVIRKVNTAGVVTTLTGNGIGDQDGNATTARFSFPSGLAMDGFGNLYVGDAGNNRVRMVTADGTVTTIPGRGGAGYVDGPGASANFNGVYGVALDGDVASIVAPSHNLYVADSFNNAIRQITLVV